ncbi:conserved hypothetical protein [Ricinus communis]|uniref:Uncharacterized protein n=1 Tax=Ricinus communis TaxID=3988 RepID=B9RVF3_RICCO|nr:conserved hypothetical protein [Ricinus communis]
MRLYGTKGGSSPRNMKLETLYKKQKRQERWIPASTINNKNNYYTAILKYSSTNPLQIF